MLQIAPQMKTLVAVEPVDFRRGIDGLARLCQETLRHDPFVVAVFVFRNRKATALKLLMYDGQGFWLFHKVPVHRCMVHPASHLPTLPIILIPRREVHPCGPRSSSES
ncbi:MAG: IS66 family insertion sequence element accessory protein TnpB [Planctomycetia bacterium]|nr:IS66 family insertion sequence element accessory protein TnpB [Planctomycetia bacterium]